jgi:hypothetical protein
MTHAILEVAPNLPMPFSPTTTVYSGTVRLGGTTSVARDRTPEDFGFFIPDAPPLDEAAEAPQVWAEVNLMLLEILNTHHHTGVDQVTAAYLPDPRGGTARWLHCGGTAFAPCPLRIAYRITVIAATP